MAKLLKDKTGTWYGGNGGLTEKQCVTNARCVAKYCKSLSSLNWSYKSCIAMLGNMGHESNVNPQRYQNGVGPGYGLVQWDPKSKYVNRAKKIKQYKSYDMMFTQLQVIDYEMTHGLQWTNRGSHYMSQRDFIENRQNKSIDYLVETFLYCYEGASALAIESRLRYAHLFDDKIEWEHISSDDGRSIDDFLEWCKKIADDNDYTYQLGANHRVPWNNDQHLKKFDCSSFVSFGLHNGGGYDLSTQFSTSTAKNDLENLGFESIKYNSARQLKRGDILLTISRGHVEVVYSVGNGGADEIKLVGAHDHYPTHPQDDINIENFYVYNWEWILRPFDSPSSKPRENPTNSNKNKHTKAPINNSQNALPPTYLKRRRRP